MLDTTTGEVVEVTLKHEGDNVREFYSSLPRPVRVGIEATGSMQWFLNLMEELGIECQVGHPAEIRAAEPRKQKHDRRDADLILKLLAENRFPAIWLPSKELLDLRALLRHRHQWVRMRTRIQNALQSIALANGLRRGTALWSRDGQSRIASLPLAPHTAYRRSELQALYEKFEAEIEELNQRVEAQAGKRLGARLLMTHPGVGPITALATEVFLGHPARFRRHIKQMKAGSGGVWGPIARRNVWMIVWQPFLLSWGTLPQFSCIAAVNSCVVAKSESWRLVPKLPGTA